MGGAEKLILELAHEVNRKEETQIVDVSPKIANIYGNLVLKRSFKNHLKDHQLKLFNHTSLSYLSFIPFTKDWQKAALLFKNARLVYTRYELLEIAICIYFMGLSGLGKVIAGMHLTPLYSSPRGIIDKVHNIVYGPSFYGYLLRSSKLVHVLNNRDKKLIETKYKVKSVAVLPPGIKFETPKSIKTPKEKLNIIFVGELSTRKGVDTLKEIITESPDYFAFHIIGDGPLKKDIQELALQNKCFYHGYTSTEKLQKTYAESDVILFPSRSEAFGMVMAEALGYGVKIVNSIEVSLDLPKNIESSITPRNSKNYINALEKIFKEKQENKIDRQRIQKFARDNYQQKLINERFTKEIVGL